MDKEKDEAGQSDAFLLLLGSTDHRLIVGQQRTESEITEDVAKWVYTVAATQKPSSVSSTISCSHRKV